MRVNISLTPRYLHYSPNLQAKKFFNRGKAMRTSLFIFFVLNFLPDLFVLWLICKSRFGFASKKEEEARSNG